MGSLVSMAMRTVPWLYGYSSLSLLRSAASPRLCSSLRRGRPLHFRPSLVSAKGNSSEDQHWSFPSSSLKRISAQVVVVILTLGFLDAGYSGDWSRIGVLSPEIESILRLAAYGVVPLAMFLLWLISKQDA